MRGRPLRFLTVTIGGWVGMRTVMLWPVAMPGALDLPPLIEQAQAAEDRPVPASPAAPPASDARPRPVATPPPTPPARQAYVPAAKPEAAAGPVAAVPAPPVAPPRRLGALAPPLRPFAIAPGPSRLAGSAWLIARGGGVAAPGGVLGGQLGASQAGARLTYALGAARRVALSARIATPLAGQGREAGLGLDWQPTRAPVHLIAEQRLALDGGRGGPTLLAVAGLNPTPIAAGLRLEAYAQAGVIARDGVEGFGDGAARLTRPVARLGRATIDLGGGAWGGIQRGARRLDVGPTLGVVAPVGVKAVRLTLDWRVRVGGGARPGSGPALSIGTDF